MESNKEKLQSKNCDWCCPKEDPQGLTVGSGIFRDFDSDLSYGIPICGGCGGLGVQYETPDFEERTKRIMELRFKYCPTDPEKQEQTTEEVRLEALETIEKEIKELIEVYGLEKQESLAAKISQGSLTELINETRKRVETINEIRKTPADPISEALKEPSIAFTEGRYKAAERLFKEALIKFPESSLIYHDYAVFLASTGDKETAYLNFKKATEFEPKMALHFFQAAKCAFQLGKTEEEVIDWLEKGKEQPDYNDFSKKQGVNFEQLFEGLPKMASQKGRGKKQSGLDAYQIIQ